MKVNTIFLLLVLVCLIELLSGQSPYNVKFHGFNNRAIQVESFAKVNNDKYGILGLYRDTIPGNPMYVETNSFISFLENNLNPICFKKITHSKDNKSTWIFSNFIEVNQDSFITYGQSVEWDSVQITHNSIYIISFDSNCKYKKLKEISIPFVNPDFTFGSRNIHNGIDSNSLYILYTRLYTRNTYDACIMKLSNQLEVLWNKCFTSKNYKSELTHLEPLQSMFFTGSGNIVLPAMKTTVPGADQKLYQLQLIYLNSNTGDEIKRFKTIDSNHYYATPSLLQTANHGLYSTLGVDTVFHPWGCCPEKEYVANKHSLAKLDFKANVSWNKRIGDNIWDGDRGYNDIIESNHKDGILMVGVQHGQFNLPDSTWDRGGIITKSNYEGEELWRRTISYNPYPYFARFRLTDIESAGSQGYFLAGEITLLNAHIDSLYSARPAMFIYVDEQGCIVPGCETVNQTSIQEEKVKLLSYPNPASDHLKIYIPTIAGLNPQNPGYLKIHDLQGKLIHSEKVGISDNTLILDAHHWSKGIYVASLTHEGELLARQKIVIQ